MAPNMPVIWQLPYQQNVPPIQSRSSARSPILYDLFRRGASTSIESEMISIISAWCALRG